MTNDSMALPLTQYPFRYTFEPLIFTLMLEDTLKERSCKNCGNLFAGSYCNHCGQKAAHRITLGHVLHDIVHVFTHADKGFFTIMPQLVFRPGILARDFIEGKRRIFNPFQYLLIMIGIVVFLLANTNFYESFEKYNAENAAAMSGNFKQVMSKFTLFVKKHSNLLTLAELPVYALFSWLFFRSRGHNYAEHITIQVFAMSQVKTISAVVLLVFLVIDLTWLGSLWITVSLAIFSMCVTYKQFYNLGWLHALWKTLAVYAISYCIQVLIMTVVIVVYVLILKSRAHG